MWIINLTPLAPGVYNDHRADHITAPPDGWAMIPDDFAVPSTFPRLGSIEAKEIVYGFGEDAFSIMTVTSMTDGTLPEQTEDVPIPTMDERLASLESENAILKAQINAQSEQMDFYEDCIAEMAMVVYA